ncbi:amidohydrolase family protein [Allorhizobium sp. BGMRC 0089]|uniref:amidohydrolase family protein n=1 Tax=Allorhizobium sonneratiae TaxID=2934936 RepID=UPI0020340BF5|nr:amidohydrolase family protein [Allorhizobium sonneratiae]MCM2292638.1 amidohydrolase family protein [Allorhizobium sonneratiae]
MSKDSPHIPVVESWLALRREEPLFPQLPIVDAHHHLWDRPGQRYLFAELLDDANQGHNVLATVFIQSRSMYNSDEADPSLRPIGEVEFANGIAAQSASGVYSRLRACAGIIGFCDLMQPERAEAILDRLVAAGGGRFRGVRNQTAWHEDAAISSNPIPPVKGLLLEEKFRTSASLLGQRGFTLDVWVYHTQLDEVYALARHCPDTMIILDHLGGPLGVGPYAGRREEVFAEWAASMTQIANLPNVFVKLGGLAMRVGGFEFHSEPVPPSSELLAKAWAPYFERVIELFGPKRCMFESNFPVDKGMVSYGVLWNAFKRMTQSYSEAERLDLFFTTAARVYALPVQPEDQH